MSVVSSCCDGRDASKYSRLSLNGSCEVSSLSGIFAVELESAVSCRL